MTLSKKRSNVLTTGVQLRQLLRLCKECRSNCILYPSIIVSRYKTLFDYCKFGYSNNFLKCKSFGNRNSNVSKKPANKKIFQI